MTADEFRRECKQAGLKEYRPDDNVVFDHPISIRFWLWLETSDKIKVCHIESPPAFQLPA